MPSRTVSVNRFGTIVAASFSPPLLLPIFSLFLTAYRSRLYALLSPLSLSLSLSIPVSLSLGCSALETVTDSIRFDSAVAVKLAQEALRAICASRALFITQRKRRKRNVFRQ